MAMLEVLRSSVNQWEIDQMGHMNVRHYFARGSDGVAGLLAALGWPRARLRQEGSMLRALEQHVRFHRELRPGTAYTLSAGVVGLAGDVLRSYQELTRKADGVLAASLFSESVLLDRGSGARRPLPAELAARVQPYAAEVPAHGQARGILRGPVAPGLRRQQAIERGLTGGFLGPVQPEDCDAQGRMCEAGMMAKLSDSMPHFFLALRDSPRPTDYGGAALEYRFVFRTWPEQGDMLEVRTGLKAIGRKTSNICHFVFDHASGECVASAEAVSVSFDLVTRRSVDIPDDVRELMQARLIPDLQV